MVLVVSFKSIVIVTLPFNILSNSLSIGLNISFLSLLLILQGDFQNVNFRSSLGMTRGVTLYLMLIFNLSDEKLALS